jgi:hypothetical protein
VQVDPAMTGDLQGRTRQESPVRHNGAAVRCDLCQAGKKVGISSPCRLEHLDAGVGRSFGDRAPRELAPAPGRGVRPGQDGDHFVLGGHQRVQGRNGRLRRPGEHDLHTHSLPSTEPQAP